MASNKNTPILGLFLVLNLLFFTLASACGGGCPSPRPKPPAGPTPKPPAGPTPKPPTGPTPKPPAGPTPKPPTGPTPKPPAGPTPKPPAPSTGKCPRDALKLGVCADVLGSLLNVTIGKPPVEPCCSLIQGLVDLEAAICLCTAIKANILGINLNIPLSLSLLLNVCSKKVPSDFQCE